LPRAEVPERLPVSPGPPLWAAIGPRRARLAPRLLALWLALALPSLPAAAQDLLRLGQPDADAEEPERSISPESSAEQDRALADRLADIFAEVEGLEDITIEVRAGVVRLGGEVVSSAAHQRAVRIANQLQGVVAVQDEIEESRRLGRRLRPVASELRERLLAFVTTLPLLAVAVGVFVLFVLLGRLLSHWEAPFRRLTRNPFAQDLARQAIRLALGLAGALVALEILDATMLFATVAGVATLAGLAASFAFRDLAENYIASVLLSLRQPFLTNEHVSIEGEEGRVVRLTLRATILMNLDGNHVRIPNAAVFKGRILNYTRNPERRFVFDVGVASETDLSRALALGISTLEQIPGLLGEPPPKAWVEALGDWNIVLRFSAWIDQRESDWFKARGEAMRIVKEAFDAAGIQMPEPIVILRSGPAPAVSPAAPGPSAEAPAAPERPAPLGAEVEVDISRQNEIEAEVDADRAKGGVDLLDASRPQE
jgi:small-conductance mechanosensitive channel